MPNSYTEALKRRLAGQTDSRGSSGIAARGSNVYNGGSANSGKNQWGSYAAPKQQKPQQTPVSSWNFNPTFAAAERRLFGNEAAANSEREHIMRRLGVQKEQFTQQLGDFRQDALKGNWENMADRGLVHSGINVGQQGKIGEEYNKQLQGVNQSHAQALEDTERTHAANLSGIQQQREQIELERARAEQTIQLENAWKQAQAESAANAQRAMDELIKTISTPTPTGQLNIQPVMDVGERRIAALRTRLANPNISDEYRAKYEAELKGKKK